MKRLGGGFLKRRGKRKGLGGERKRERPSGDMLQGNDSRKISGEVLGKRGRKPSPRSVQLSESMPS